MIDLTCLQGETPGGEELICGTEVVALSMKPVHDLKSCVYRLGIDVVEQNDAAVLSLGHHLFHHPGGIFVVPVLRIDGPENNGAVCPGAHPLVPFAEGGTE